MIQLTSPRHQIEAVASPIAGRVVVRFPPAVTRSVVNPNTFSIYNSSRVNLYKEASPYVTTSPPDIHQANSSAAWRRGTCAGCIRHARQWPASDHASQQAGKPRTWWMRHQRAVSRSRPCTPVADLTRTRVQRYSPSRLACGLHSRNSCVVSGLRSELIHGCTA